MWFLIIFIFLDRYFIDWKNANKVTRVKAMLAAGSVSKRIIEKLCQDVNTTEKSENIREKKFTNPDWLKSDKSILTAGTKPVTDAINITEKITIFLKTKNRSSL